MRGKMPNQLYLGAFANYVPCNTEMTICYMAS